MLRASRLLSIPLAMLCFACFSHAQNPPEATAALREVHATGMKTLTEAQVQSFSGLQTGQPVGRGDLQAAADKLGQTGLFSNVKYDFQTLGDGVALTFHVEEIPRNPAYFDNFPWFGDVELNSAIRKKLPFYDGTLPAGGAVLDQALAAVNEFLAAHGLTANVQHQAIASPDNNGSVEEIYLDTQSLRIASVQFADASLNSSHALQQQMSELVGKPYSRMAIDLFLTEHVRPMEIQRGYLQAKLGPPEVRLTGNPNQKLPEQIPVFIPVSLGAVYQFKIATWVGNTNVTSQDLTTLLNLKPGDVANGMALESAWERVRDEYAHRGFIDAKIDPQPSFDDAAHTVTYTVHIDEGSAYRYTGMVVTGLSPVAEKMLRDAFPVSQNRLMDKVAYEKFLTTLQTHPGQVFKDLPVHYDTVGHWLQTDASKGTVQVLLDFK